MYFRVNKTKKNVKKCNRKMYFCICFVFLFHMVNSISRWFLTQSAAIGRLSLVRTDSAIYVGRIRSDVFKRLLECSFFLQSSFFRWAIFPLLLDKCFSVLPRQARPAPPPSGNLLNASVQRVEQHRRVVGKSYVFRFTVHFSIWI